MNATVACTVCEAAVGLVQADVNLTNATIAGISVAVKAMCAVFASKVGSEECDVIVNSIDKIISWIDAGVSRLQICKNLKLC